MAVDLNHKLEQTRKAMTGALTPYIRPDALEDMLNDAEVRLRGDGVTEVHTKGGWVTADEDGVKRWAHQKAALAGGSARLPRAGMSEEEMQDLMRRQRKAVGY